VNKWTAFSRDFIHRCCDLENKITEKLKEIERLKQEIVFSQKYRKEQEDFIRLKKDAETLKEKVRFFVIILRFMH